MTSQQCAYLAGFLDADGSILLQFRPNKKMRFLYRVKAVVVIYQDAHSINLLRELQSVIGAGYISERNDRIAELRIEGFIQVEKLLKKLKPYLRFKKSQADYLLQALKILKRKKYSLEDFLSVCDLAEAISAANYKSSQRKHTKQSILNNLRSNGIVPVTTGFLTEKVQDEDGMLYVEEITIVNINLKHP